MEREKKDIAIVGGGAAGLFAAIICARNGARVSILEHTQRLGKKLLSTGNGRCNYTNLEMTLEKFYGNDFAFDIIKRFDERQTIEFFKELGIEPIFRDGYAYPYSLQASAIQGVLEREVKRLGVAIFYEFHIEDLQVDSVQSNRGGKPRFTINQKYHFDAVIFATGSKAFPISGSDASILPIYHKLGFRIMPFLPSLVPIYTDRKNFLKKVSGVRVRAKLSLYIEEEKIMDDIGEVQLTDYGLSGIPSFQLSRYVSKALLQKKKVKILVDFLPDIHDKKSFLMERARSLQSGTWENFGIGIWNDKLWKAIYEECIPKGTKENARLDTRDIHKVLQEIAQMEFQPQKTGDYEKAQVCTGGISIKELTNDLEAKKYPCLFFAGEVIDVDGVCGGYNLQWAWSSAYVAAMKASR